MSDLDDGLMNEAPTDTAGPTWGPPSPVGPAGSRLDPAAAAAVDAQFAATAADSPGAETEEVENHFPNVYVFVQHFLVKVYARPVRAQLSWRWCSQWWNHPEAVSRLEALWKAFEILRRDPGTGAATWWRDYADPTMAALSDAAGTFAKCSDTTHAIPPDLPMDDPAAWLLKSDGATLDVDVREWP